VQEEAKGLLLREGISVAWFETVWSWIVHGLPFPFNIIGIILFWSFLFALPIAIVSAVIDLITEHLGKE